MRHTRLIHHCAPQPALHPSHAPLVIHHLHELNAPLFVRSHNLCNKSLNVKDWLAPEVEAVLVKGGAQKHLRLEAVVEFLEQLHRQPLHHHLGRDARAEQLINLGPHLQKPLGRLLLEHIVCDDAYKPLPVSHLHLLILAEVALLHLARLHHQQRPAHVAVRRHCHPLRQALWEGGPLLVAHSLEHLLDIPLGGRGDSDGDAPGPDRLNHLAGVVAHEDKPAR
mmetsp:Transcript_45634/g.111104  ORF Transcript_45634/g.111104 Transcript_45634/m.111104 type:complete len:223 (-) Transcript_45634:532-1200(-)